MWLVRVRGSFGSLTPAFVCPSCYALITAAQALQCDTACCSGAAVRGGEFDGPKARPPATFLRMCRDAAGSKPNARTSGLPSWSGRGLPAVHYATTVVRRVGGSGVQNNGNPRFTGMALFLKAVLNSPDPGQYIIN